MERPGLLTQKGNSKKEVLKNPENIYFRGFFIFNMCSSFLDYFFLNIKFIKNKITIAPIAPVKIAPIHPPPSET